MRVSLPFPRGRDGTPSEPPAARRRGRRRLAAGLLAALLVASAAGAYYWRALAAPAAPLAMAPVMRADLAVNVESSGTVKPAQSIELPFQADGQVRDVLVRLGDQVRAGQPLARLDDHDLRLQVQQAEADLKTAQARLEAAQHGGATQQELAQAGAQLASSEAGLERARTGNITAADIREAEASLRTARAQLDALKNPSSDKVSAAQLALTEAETGLQRTRDELSAAKTNAESELNKSVAALTQSQSSYSTAKQSWTYVQDTGKDPVNPSTTNAKGEKVDNKLSDAQRQEYYDAFVKAEAALRSAEETVKQAQLSYDTARQKEVVGVQEAEARIANARQQLDALLHPNANALTQAEAAVTQAQARLDKLRQGGTRADVAQAQAAVDGARAGLEKLTAPAATADLAAAQADVAQAQAGLDAAKLELDRATLAAPFAATVTEISIAPGSVVGTATTAIALVDTSALYVDVSLSENDVALVKPGQTVDLAFDALPDVTLTGTVDLVLPVGASDQGVVTYPVRVRFDPGQAQVKVGMSASVTIEVERHSQVIQVPSRAITTLGPIKTVQVLSDASETPTTMQVETGATNGAMTEIKGCVEPGKQCLKEGDKVLINLPTDDGGAGGLGEPGGNVIRMAAPAGPGGGKQVIIQGP
jgi:HlyD family secretion protein